MKRLKIIVKKKKREKKKRKAPYHSQEIQVSLKIVGFLILQGPDLSHCPDGPIFIIIDCETRPLV